MAMTTFEILLLRASKAMGSLLDVANLLEVEPKQVYWWMANLERPNAALQAELERRLRRALGAPSH